MEGYGENMARNKHPQETANRIMDVAFRLFIEKGYEHTSIQDIIDHLGGLSKGAIYHHFKSKEEILIAATDRMTAESNDLLAQIRDRPDLNGKEKLITIFKTSIFRPVQNEIFSAAPNLGNNPKLIFEILRDTIDEVVPQYVMPIVEQGAADGSIQTEYPKELSEVLLLMVNFWMNPMIFNDSEEAAERKFRVLKKMLQGYGLEDVLDEEMLARLKELAHLYQENK